jgi:5-aminolevulinate synthase
MKTSINTIQSDHNFYAEDDCYDVLFSQAIGKLKEEGRYRVFANLERRVGQAPYAFYKNKVADNTGNIKEVTKKVTVWCSNDYLGMSHHPAVLHAMKDSLDLNGGGAGGTRNISGNHSTIIELEQELASIHNKESALVFSSGYVANQTTLQTLGTLIKDCVFFSDEDNHASMIEGIRHSRAEKHVFKHSDPEHLEYLLKQHDINRPKIVAFESVYSMGGDIAPIAEIVEVSKKYNALTFIDETHAVGLYGTNGAGIVQSMGMLDELDCIQGGLGKGYGVVGGFVTGSANLIDAVRSYGAGFIFTTTIPPVVACGALASVRHLKESSSERRAMMQQVRMVRDVLKKYSIQTMCDEAHIIPVLIGDSAKCKKVSDTLLKDHDIYIQPINYPTVPKGTERLRITPTPLHNEEMAEHLGKSLSRVLFLN